MDLSPLCTADQRQSPQLPSDSETKDSDCILQGSTVETVSPDQTEETPLPHPSQDLFLPESATLSEFHLDQDQSLSQSYLQENTMPESTGAVSSSFEGLTDSFVSESSYTCENSPAASLLRPLSPQSHNLESDVVVAASLSELYIFESDTQDFILSSMVEPPEINCSEYQSLTQTWSPHECDTNVLVCDSTDIVTQCHHSSSKDYDIEMDESGQRPPASDALKDCLIMGNDERETKAEVTGFYAQLGRSNSPIELWLDACQYLAGEDTGDEDVLEKTEHSVMERGLFATSDLSLLPGETQVSDFSPDGSEVIGWPGDDTRGWGPRVERWSSVDSWASALSDWTGIIEAPPNDFTAAFAEIGAEIDALTQALAEVNTAVDTETEERYNPDTTEQPAMGVQDQTHKEQNKPESSIHSSQSCPSLCLEAIIPGLSDSDSSRSVESLCDSGQEEKDQEESQSSPNYTPQRSSMGSSSAMVPLMPRSSCSSDLDLSDFDEYVKISEKDVFTSKTDPVILNITEDTDLKSSSGRLTKKPFEDGLCEVTDECSVSQLDWSLGLSEENKSTTDPNFFTVRSVTSSHVPSPNSQPGQHINVHTHLSFDTLPHFDEACQVGPQLGTPKFITPLAPLGIGSSLLGQTSWSLERDQTSAPRRLSDNTDLSSDCAVSPTSDGNTGETSLESDEDLIHKKEDTTSTAKTSSQKGQVDTHDAGESVFTAKKSLTEEINDFNRQLELENLTAVPANHFFISKQTRIACITLNLHDPLSFRAAKPISRAVNQAEKMPHKTHKTTSENKSRTKKDKSTSNHHSVPASKKQDSLSHHVPTQQTCKKQETHPAIGENLENTASKLEAKEAKLVTETSVITEKATSKPHGKKKKKHIAASGVNGSEPVIEVEIGTKPKTAKGRIDMFEAKLGAKPQKETGDGDKKSQQVQTKVSQEEQASHLTDLHSKSFTGPPNDDVIKRRRLSEDKFGKIVKALEIKLPDASLKAKGEELKVDAGANRKKAYSEVVKQNIPVKEDLKVVQPIQAVSVSGDPQSLCLWCQFAAVFSDYTVTWSREGTVLAEIKRSAGDESRVSVTITNASHKDLGKYQCKLNGLHSSLTLDYLLTYEVLSEIVIPPSPTIISPAPVELPSEEEDVHYSKLMFNEDFLTDQYFGENTPISIITEKVHFGEGMHRRAFRTKLHGGQIPLLLPGHPCVLKVHNAITYGTKNNEELIQKNFSLAVEECHVQNTARQYIKAYTAAAQTVDAFGDVPEIIPIYLIHRLSNDIPYATLEEELIGDFVKYSVKDGKEINLMRRDSEAGQKCCAFQHWVYHKTEGNLLVTDMQGVGMRLTDVGIATPKKGYKGFKGNCATSFIDQFKALHQCNMYCELLGLKSLQPKPKKPSFVPKPKPQPSAAPKKKTFGPTVKGKS